MLLSMVIATAACSETGAAPGGSAAPSPDAPTHTILSYGAAPDQVADLTAPPAAGRNGLTVVLLHGGFWRDGYGRDLMEPLVGGLVDAGHVVVNLEYRRVGGSGGWPETFLDVAAGIDQLATRPEVDPRRIVTVGHSAGGHLALWAAARPRLPSGSPGSEPAVSPCGAISLAGVNALARAAAEGVGGRAVPDLLGGEPSEVPDRLDVADPAALLPFGLPVVVVHGEDDAIVPPTQSTGFAQDARMAGDDVTVIVGAGDHFSVIDPEHELWRRAQQTLIELC